MPEPGSYEHHGLVGVVWTDYRIEDSEKQGGEECNMIAILLEVKQHNGIFSNGQNPPFDIWSGLWLVDAIYKEGHKPDSLGSGVHT